jgi:hypothetical protein
MFQSIWIFHVNRILKLSVGYQLGPALRFFRPYNARLTREAVAPFRPAWKGRTKGGSGATFAVRPNPMTHPSKGRDGHAESG